MSAPANPLPRPPGPPSPPAARKRLTKEEREAALRQRAEAAADRARQAAARAAQLRARVNQADRKKDTRWKILLGALADHIARKDPAVAAALAMAAAGFFTREDDKALAAKWIAEVRRSRSTPGEKTTGTAPKGTIGIPPDSEKI